jgi:hypothetical protein
VTSPIPRCPREVVEETVFYLHDRGLSSCPIFFCFSGFPPMGSTEQRSRSASNTGSRSLTHPAGRGFQPSLPHTAIIPVVTKRGQGSRGFPSLGIWQVEKKKMICKNSGSISSWNKFKVMMWGDSVPKSHLDDEMDRKFSSCVWVQE